MMLPYFPVTLLPWPRQWVTAGCRQLHLVDLDGAFAGQPVNGDIIKAIATTYPDLSIQIGGGIRSAEVIESYLSAGVQFVIIGTQAVRDPKFCQGYVQGFRRTYYGWLGCPRWHGCH